MEFVSLLMLGIGALLLVSVLATLISERIGAPLLLVFLLLGMLLGEDGPGGIVFNNVDAAFLVASLALAIILFDGGLRTPRTSFRLGLQPAIVLATIGVVVTAGITGAAAIALFDLPMPRGLLIGAIVGSTDAAAVFSTCCTRTASRSMSACAPRSRSTRAATTRWRYSSPSP